MKDGIETVQERAKRLVDVEVYASLSTIVSKLAEMEDEQAMFLCYGVPDYEEAAIQAGWSHVDDGEFGSQNIYRDSNDGQTWAAKNWQELCEAIEIEPYDREVFEHWSVSKWLGEKLTAKGEKVDDDFLGHVVWARTTTGQAVYLDGVIEAIAADCLKGA